jgi:FeS assembly SUF system protein
MGIFSFLAGKGRTRAAAPTSAEAPSPRPIEAPGAPAAPGPAVPDRPAAWDFGALHSPPPETPRDGVEVGRADPARTAELKPRVVEALSTIFEPEIPVNIYELGLIYDVRVDDQARVAVTMTLTSPACPSAQQLPSEARWKVKAVPGVADAHVEVVWEPPWTKDRMSDAAKLALGLW